MNLSEKHRVRLLFYIELFTVVLDLVFCSIYILSALKTGQMLSHSGPWSVLWRQCATVFDSAVCERSSEPHRTDLVSMLHDRVMEVFIVFVVCICNR